jgi:hypothetical protein
MLRTISRAFQSLQSIQNRNAFLKKKLKHADSSCPGRREMSWAGPSAAFPRWHPAEPVCARSI